MRYWLIISFSHKARSVGRARQKAEYICSSAALATPLDGILSPGPHQQNSSVSLSVLAAYLLHRQRKRLRKPLTPGCSILVPADCHPKQPPDTSPNERSSPRALEQVLENQISLEQLPTKTKLPERNDLKQQKPTAHYRLQPVIKHSREKAKKIIIKW